MAREIDALSRQEFEHEMLQGSLAPEKVDFLCRKVAQAPEVQAQDWADFLKSEAELFATKISAARVKQVNEIYEQLRQHDFVAHDKLVPFKATIACLNEDSFKKALWPAPRNIAQSRLQSCAMIASNSALSTTLTC